MISATATVKLVFGVYKAKVQDLANGISDMSHLSRKEKETMICTEMMKQFRKFCNILPAAGTPLTNRERIQILEMIQFWSPLSDLCAGSDVEEYKTLRRQAIRNVVQASLIPNLIKLRGCRLRPYAQHAAGVVAAIDFLVCVLVDTVCLPVRLRKRSKAAQTQA